VSVIDLDQTWSRGGRQLTGAAYHEGVPAHGGALEGAELGDGPVEVEHHHHIGGWQLSPGFSGETRFVLYRALGGGVGCRPRPLSSSAFIGGFADL
jgi:hypothetical protein